MPKQKVVLITGCSSGIGFETALIFARGGYQTYATMRNVKGESAEKLKTIAEQEKLLIAVLPLDVTSETTIQTAVKRILQDSGGIDVVVNNAGFGFLGAVEDFSIEEVETQYDTNIFGALRLIKAVAPHMRKQNSGTIINISSVNGILSLPLYGVYASSKFALEALTATLRFELYPFGIRVALVEPGVFASQFTQNRKHPALQGSKNSVYNQLSQPFFQKLNPLKNVENPLLKKIWNPTRVARKIYILARMENPPLHTVVGIDAHILLLLNHLPEWIKLYLFQKAFSWTEKSIV